MSQMESGKKRQKTGESSVGNTDGDGPNLKKFHEKRIIDVQTLSENLVCSKCQEVLSLCDIQDERRIGLASAFKIKCKKCTTMNVVETNAKHVSNAGKEIFNINTEAALGVLHAGMGYSHLNKFLACIDSPVIDSKLFKRHEREVGKTVEAVAKESCSKWAETERELTIKNADELASLL
ncbi:uncharacterized protein [Venturia canescens]|uniref:uncharacterized protein n=1 Tax=Venturia canescens TaxID=32260 RepID=UPI001C9BC635|nr:uncharacterized protein LOC122408226 [Venturia canescens]